MSAPGSSTHRQNKKKAVLQRRLFDKTEASHTSVVIPDLFTIVPSSSLDKKDLIHVMLRHSLTSGSFIDTKFFAFSKRRAGGGVDGALPVYANSGLLTASSRYFDGLFRADFAENRTSLLDSKFPSDKEDLKNMYDYESDSDLEDEVDEDTHDLTAGEQEELSLVAQSDREGKQCGSDSCTEDEPLNSESAAKDPPGREQYGRTIIISDCAFKTWKAFIFYLYTGEVAFSPLRSQPDRTKAQKKSIAPRCSPKSMYRLADKYDIPDLKAKAEQAIIDQLSADNILRELRSSTTTMYAGIREKEVAFACQGGPARGIVLSGIAQWITDLTKGEVPHTANTLHSVVQKLAGGHNWC